MTLKKKPFKNIVGKGVNAGNQHFLLFPQCFLPFPKQISIFQSHSFCHLQMLSISTRSNFVVWLVVNPTAMYRELIEFSPNNIIFHGKDRKHEKPEKMLITTFFHFYHNVFRHLLSQGCYNWQLKGHDNKVLFPNRLTLILQLVKFKRFADNAVICL